MATGDYNVDLLKVNNTQFNDDYFHNILSAGYIPKVTLPTRLSESSTLIDNVFTTNSNSDLSTYILDIHISEHQPVVLFTNVDIPPTRSKYITIRANTNDRKDNFRQCFHNKHIFDQLDKDIHVTDPNYNYEIFEHAIKETHIIYVTLLILLWVSLMLLFWKIMPIVKIHMCGDWRLQC